MLCKSDRQKELHFLQKKKSQRNRLKWIWIKNEISNCGVISIWKWNFNFQISNEISMLKNEISKKLRCGKFQKIFSTAWKRIWFPFLYGDVQANWFTSYPLTVCLISNIFELSRSLTLLNFEKVVKFFLSLKCALQALSFRIRITEIEAEKFSSKYRKEVFL